MSWTSGPSLTRLLVGLTSILSPILSSPSSAISAILILTPVSPTSATSVGHCSDLRLVLVVEGWEGLVKGVWS